MNNIQFFRGPDAGYHQGRKSNKFTDALYFATDTKLIYLNDKAYGGNGLPSDVDAVVTQVAINNDGQLVVRYSDGRDAAFYEINYVSSYNDDMVVPVSVGGIEAGTKVKDLKTKSISQVLDELLFPTTKPEMSISPSCNFGFSDTAHKGKTNVLVELGTPKLALTQASLNRGKWTTGDDYAGDISTYTYTFNVNGNTVVNSTSGTPEVPLYNDTKYNVAKKSTYTAKIAYNSTSTKNNKGESVPGSGGEVSKTLTVDVGLYWYASTDENKKNLIQQGNDVVTITSKVIKEVTLQPHSNTETGYKQSIKVPVKSGITPVINVWDTVSSRYIDETEFWSVSTVTESVNGIDTNYYYYTFNGDSRGAVKVQIEF